MWVCSLLLLVVAVVSGPDGVCFGSGYVPPEPVTVAPFGQAGCEKDMYRQSKAMKLDAAQTCRTLKVV